MSEELPFYQSKATPEEKEQTHKLMAEQIGLILEQYKDEIPAKFLKIRCNCGKFPAWMFMYRCLYCGVWFCSDCAEHHFGFRVPKRNDQMSPVGRNKPV
ncbi:MAG: hypothetical protein QX197_10520 [Methylococcaceae bacterium]